MLKQIYDWTLSLAARKSAEYWLALIGFVESSFFFLPADILFLAMGFAQPRKAYRYAAIATLASAAGGIFGYWLGLIAYEGVIKPTLSFYGELAQFEKMKSCASDQTLLLLLATSGLAHIPPIKIVTILAGVARISLPFFIVSCVIFRGLRFFALAWALQRWGTSIREFIEKRLGMIVGLIAAILLGLYLAVKLLGHGGGFSC